MTFPVLIKAQRKRVNVGKEIAQINRLRLSYERSLTSTLIREFQRVAREAARSYSAGGNVDVATVTLDARMGDIMRAHYTDVISTFGLRALEGMKLEARFERLIDQYILLFAADRISNVNKTTRNLIRAAIFAGEADGLGVSAIADLILERVGGSMARSRAATIARTETHAAASYGSHEIIKESTLRFNKRWSSVRDGRVRSHHAAMDGVTVGPDEDFIVRVNGTEYRMAHTHDPRGGAINNINCRCVTLYIADDDEVFGD